jgi:hypothetical protein
LFGLEDTSGLCRALSAGTSTWEAIVMPTRPIGLAAAATVRGPSMRDRPRPERGSAERSDAFDTWLRRRLQQSYGAIASEPIPEELLRLLEEDRNA